MRTLSGAALALLLTALPLAASAEPSAGPPKPGKCSVATEGVGTDASGAGSGLLVAAACIGAARARRRGR